MARSLSGGRLIFISSVCGPKTVVPGLAHYGAAKAGLEALVRGAAVELGPNNITVNSIAPGFIATDRVRASLPEAVANKISSRFPLGRIGQSEDVADSVLFLASDAGRYLTGISLTLDGGACLATSSDVSSALDAHESGPGGVKKATHGK
jgi:3-oxoacyl-[acyl-carrier protein] reductase